MPSVKSLMAMAAKSIWGASVTLQQSNGSACPNLLLHHFELVLQAAEQQEMARIAAWHAAQPPLHVALGVSMNEARELVEKAHAGDVDARSKLQDLNSRGPPPFSSTKKTGEVGEEQAAANQSNHQSWVPRAHPSKQHLDTLAGIRQHRFIPLVRTITVWMLD